MDKIWLVSFMEYDIGYFDEEVGRVGPRKNPFGSKVLPIVLSINCNLCGRYRPKTNGGT